MSITPHIMSHTTSFKFLIPLTIALVVLISYNFMSAQWLSSTSTPPNNNVAAPLNISSNYQAKLGDLGAIRMRSGEYCDAAGLNCYTTTELASGGATGITQLTGGVGITLSPTTITTTGTVAINPTYTQRRIVSACPVGQSLRQINVDGTVVCQITEAPVTCIKNGLQYSPGAGCRLSLPTPTCTSGSVRHHYDVCQADGTWSRSFSCQGYVMSYVPAYRYPSCP
jgi:hypothetical protein